MAARSQTLKLFLLGGGIFIVVGLLGEPSLNWLRQPSASNLICQKKISSSNALSRDQLAQVLELSQPSKSEVRSLLQDPYCQLSDTQLQSGVLAQREAYALEFDSQTQLVILYANEQYIGYEFAFQAL